MSYLTQLCKKRVNETRIKEGSPKEEQRPFRHSEICRHGEICHHGLNEFQNVSIQLALKFAIVNQREKVHHSEGKARKMARSDSRDHFIDVQSSPWQNILSWRAKAVWNNRRITW